MNLFKLTIAIAFLALVFTSCSKDKDDVKPLENVVSKTIKNLHAPQTGGHGKPVSGEFTKFDFSTGKKTNSETDWDIAFRATTIIVNGGESSGTTSEPKRTGSGGAYIVNGTLAEIKNVDISKFKQDGQKLAIPVGTGNGWYTYASTIITATAGKILVFRTADGKYAKVEILSYYKDLNAKKSHENSRYYTFNYVYQPNEITTF